MRPRQLQPTQWLAMVLLTIGPTCPGCSKDAASLSWHQMQTSVVQIVDTPCLFVQGRQIQSKLSLTLAKERAPPFSRRVMCIVLLEGFHLGGAGFARRTFRKGIRIRVCPDLPMEVCFRNLPFVLGTSLPLLIRRCGFGRPGQGHPGWSGAA